MARGLILDHVTKTIVATPFPKFFNAFEHGQAIPDLPFTAYDKVDGSLIILFFHEGIWRATTKGAFNTVQARQASRLLPVSALDAKADTRLVPGTTYLLEYTGPENRIIIDYPEPALHLLSGYWEDGREFTDTECGEIATTMGWELVQRYQFDSFYDIVSQTDTLPASREGYVVRFSDGTRMKIKGSAYCRLHSLVSRITPLGVWEIICANEPFEDIKEKIPEEFWKDFEDIYLLIENKASDLFQQVHDFCRPLHGLTDKEVGLRLKEFPENLRRFIFPYRKYGGAPIGREYENYCKMIYRAIRPDANYLPGYTPSYMVERLNEES